MELFRLNSHRIIKIIPTNPPKKIRCTFVHAYMWFHQYKIHKCGGASQFTLFPFYLIKGLKYIHVKVIWGKKKYNVQLILQTNQ